MSHYYFTVNNRCYLPQGWTMGQRVHAPRYLPLAERRLWVVKVQLCLQIDWLQSQLTADDNSERLYLEVYNGFLRGGERKCHTWRSLTSKRSRMRAWVIQRTPGARAWLVPPPIGPRPRV
ncbi:hypothetical protein MMC11_005516 [Xylographa trunciseda]|nr:hypothetical protein [Xylographa trunciseda]